jgi:hypothetical protein
VRRGVRVKSLFAILLLGAAHHACASADSANDRVMVLGALHTLHEREPAFDYGALGKAIMAFAPDILVLEVRPDELEERKPTPGRPEYPAVVWPLLDQLAARTVAMEPGGDLFTDITGAAGAAFEALRQRDPAGAAALSRLDKAIDEALLAYWQAPRQVQDEQTTAMANGLQAAQFALAGPPFAAAQARWDGHMASEAVRVVLANPGKRVMVLASYRNRAMLENAVRSAAPQRVIPAATWLDGLSGPAQGGETAAHR